MYRVGHTDSVNHQSTASNPHPYRRGAHPLAHHVDRISCQVGESKVTIAARPQLQVVEPQVVDSLVGAAHQLILQRNTPSQCIRQYNVVVMPPAVAHNINSVEIIAVKRRIGILILIVEMGTAYQNSRRRGKTESPERKHLSSDAVDIRQQKGITRVSFHLDASRTRMAVSGTRVGA